MKKIISIILAVLLISGVFVTPAFADVGDNEFSERESNNSMSLADRIYNDYTVNGSISSKNDIDFFKFTLSSTTRVTLLCMSTRSVIMVGIADSDGDIIDAALPSYDDGYYWDIFDGNLPSGTYYIVILQDQDYSYTNTPYMFYFTTQTTAHTHSYSTRVVSPTCTQQGYTVYTCSCGYSYNGNYTSARGHSYGSWSTVTAATCTSTGTKKRTCNTCGYSQTETIAKGSHTPGSWIIDSAATCSAEGSKHKVCTKCGVTVETQTIAKLAHTPGNWITDSVATCSTAGSKHRECTTCGQIAETQTIAKLPHTTTDWIVDKQASCSTTGSQHKECTVCGEVAETQMIAKLPHATGEWIIDREATCSKTGSKHTECSMCGEVAETQSIPKKAHIMSDWEVIKKASVNSAGEKVIVCEVCGETVNSEEIPQLKCSKPSVKKVENTADGVKITWGKVKGADKYDVYRKTGSGSYKKIATVKGNSKVTYTDKKASSGKKCYYQVKAVNEAGSSSASSAKSILYLADTTLSTPKSTKSGITLKWKKVTGADGYQVYRKTGSGSYSKIATVKGNSKVAYTDKSAKKGKKYTYKIKAYKSKTYSAYSNTKSITDKY